VLLRVLLGLLFSERNFFRFCALLLLFLGALAGISFLSFSISHTLLLPSFLPFSLLLLAWAELDKLAGLPNLKDVLFIGNPIYAEMSRSEARIEVLRHLPNITKIDGEMVKQTERDAAMGVVE
jgi:hypothetical protein